MTIRRRWQYQVKAEPVFTPAAAPAAPDFGWFQQHPEPLSLLRHPVGGVAAPVAEHEAIVPSFGWNVPQVHFNQPPRLVTEGATVTAPPQLVAPLDWDIQEPEPLPLPTRPASEVTVPPSQKVAAFDWFRQPVEVPRAPQPLVPEGQFSLGAVPIEPPFDWRQQASEPLQISRSPGSQTVLTPFEEAAAEEFFLDWFVQGSDIPLLQHRLQTQAEAFIATVETVFTVSATTGQIFLGEARQTQGRAEPPSQEVVPLDWFRQPVEVPRPPVQPIAEGFFALREPPIVAFDWRQQASEPLRILRPLESQLVITLFEEEEAEVPFDWFQQPPEPLRAQGRTQSQAFAFIFTPLPDFDWFQQGSDILRQKKTELGQFALGEPPIVVFDWQQQASEPQRKISAVTEIQQPQVFKTEFPEHLDWLRQQAEPIREERRPAAEKFEPVDFTVPPLPTWEPEFEDLQKPGPWRPYWLAGEFRNPFEVPPEVVTLDKWWVQHFNPVIRPIRPPSNVTFPLPIIGTEIIVVFEIRDCLLMWEVFENSLLPLPSGFSWPEEIIAPSGFIEEQEILTPSGYQSQDSTTLWDIAKQ